MTNSKRTPTTMTDTSIILDGSVQNNIYGLLALTIRWRFGAVDSDVGRMNEVTLRRARLVLGWVTAAGNLSQFTNHPGHSAWPFFRG